ncbi:MAG: restriction endonuclease subunit S [Anaerolineales bacterium]|nr:restriction endonuclease subunit S [Anaerolineales bacterium]
MDVKKGYKQTEVGVIPDDWIVKPCSAISDLITVGIVIRPTQYYVKQGVPALRSANIREKGINDFDMVFISEKANKLLSKSQLRSGDVVSVRTGYPGTSAVVPPSLAGANCIDLLITRPSKSINSTFLAYWINSSHGKDQVLRNQGGLAQQHFNVSELRNLVVAIPPTLAEQQAIAEALSDADALLESLEHLLAKKRQIKQGAMQELLTGRRRLEGFEKKTGYKQTELGLIPEDWEIKRLGELFEITSSKRVFQSEWKNKGIPFYRARELAVLGENGFVRNELFISKEMYENFKKTYGVPKIGDMLVTGVGTLGKVYVVPDDQEFYFKDGNIIWFQNSGKVNSDFLRQLYLTPLIMKQIEDASAGTTVGTYTISGAKKTIIPYPYLDEQTAIADILSDMDAEIAALEAKLVKARQVKQGMMQELLTGRIRLNRDWKD